MAVRSWMMPALLSLSVFFLIGIYQEIKQMRQDVTQVMMNSTELNLQVRINTGEIQTLKSYHSQP